MILQTVTFQNLSVGPLYGVMGFRVDVREGEGNSPSSCAKTLAEVARRTLKSSSPSIPFVFEDSLPTEDLAALFYHLRQERLPFYPQIVLRVTQGTLGVAGGLADLILIHATESTWTGLMGNALILTLEEGKRDPTDGYPPNLYPLGFWLEKGETVTSEQFVLYALRYPKWKIVVPPRITYSMVVYRQEEL